MVGELIQIAETIPDPAMEIQVHADLGRGTVVQRKWRASARPTTCPQGHKSAEDLGKNEAWEVDHFTPKAEIYATTLY